MPFLEGSQPCAGISRLKRLCKTLGRNTVEALNSFKIAVCHDIFRARTMPFTPMAVQAGAKYLAVESLAATLWRTSGACASMTERGAYGRDDGGFVKWLLDMCLEARFPRAPVVRLGR